MRKRKGRERENTNMDRRKPPSSGGAEGWGAGTLETSDSLCNVLIFEKTQNTSSKTWTCLTHRGEVHKCLLDGSFFFFFSCFEAFPNRTRKRGDVLAGEGSAPALVATGGRAGQRERRGQVVGGPHRHLETQC